MKNLCIMFKPASSLCNLRCRYCFYADIAAVRAVPSFGIMTQPCTDAVLTHIRDGLCPGDSVTFAFQGGEPTLAGLDWFRHFTSVTDGWKGIQLSYALQTNATALDDAWCAFLKAHRFLVGVSWDILPGCHNDARRDAAGAGTNRRVLESIALLNRWGVDYNVLCTLTSFVARHPGQVWNQLRTHDIRYVQFTPCLDELEQPGQSPYALTPRRFFSFYDRLFPLWYADFQAGHYRSVKLFDDLVNLLAYGMPIACGIDGHCRPQMVVEADGSAYPCDFFCTDAYRLGSLAEEDLRVLYESPAMTSFLNRPHRQPELCRTCAFLPFCGGGCKRMQRQVCCSEADRFCGYQAFLQAHFPKFREIAMQQRRSSKP